MTDVSGVTRTAFGDRDDYADPDGWCSHWDQTENTFDAKDSATALVRCENGATISPDVSWVTNRETNTGVTVRGTDAGASLALGGDTLSVNETGAGSRDHYADTEYEANDEVSGHRAEDELSLRVVTDDGSGDQHGRRRTPRPARAGRDLPFGGAGVVRHAVTRPA